MFNVQGSMFKVKKRRSVIGSSRLSVKLIVTGQ